MNNIVTLLGYTPQLGENTWIADTARVIGDVVLGDDCSVWYNAVIRGDVNSIRIGNRVNVQDGAVIHCTYEKTKTIIDDNVSIGHQATIHGCNIEKNVLVGIHAVILDDAYIEENVLVAAGALVPEGKRLESGWIYAGVPAKPFKKLSEDQFQQYIARIANNYVKYASWYK